VAALAPTPAFSSVALDLFRIPPGTIFGRIYHERFLDPLGFGKGRSRFSDPRRRIAVNRFGVLYLGSSLRVCFLEAVLRDERDGVVGDFPMPESELHTRRYAEIRVRSALRVLDLRGDGPVRMGIPSDVVRSSRQSLARSWSVAFHEHPEGIDGIIYPSRLNNATNLAVYDRAIGKLEAHRIHALMNAPGLADVLDDLLVSLM
jgi:hypothetical protein